MSNRAEKVKEALMHAAAEFLAREANRDSLITVTNAILSEDGKHGTILLSVFPDEAEVRAVEFANRHRREFSEFFRTHVRGAHVPHVEFALDRGEKNRQRLEQLGE